MVVTERTKVLTAYTQLNTACFRNCRHIKIARGLSSIPLFVLVFLSSYLHSQLLFFTQPHTLSFLETSLIPTEQVLSHSFEPALHPSLGLFLTYLYLLCVISLFTCVSLSLPNLHMQWEQTFQMHHFSLVISISERSNLMSYFATHMYKLISNLATSEVVIHTPCFNLHGRTHF